MSKIGNHVISLTETIGDLLAMLERLIEDGDEAVFEFEPSPGAFQSTIDEAKVLVARVKATGQ